MKKTQALRVLIVDDEPLIRWSLAETLTHAGHLVEEAGDAKQTLRTLTNGFQPDVVLLDFRLPDSNDLTLLRHIRRLAPESAVVMMTAFSTPDVIAGAEQLGAYRVLSKPVEMNELVPLVLESHAARQPPLNPH